MAGYIIYTYSLSKFQDNVIGLRFDGKGIFVGVIIGIAFMLIHKLIPVFALGMPSLPLSLTNDVRAFIIVLMAPILEESWRSSVIGQIVDIYNVSPAKANLIQAPIFSALHFLAYGLVLGSYDKWIEIYGAFVAISGLFIAALIAGYLFGWLMIKTKNVLPSQVGHGIINGVLWTSGYAVFS